MKFDKTFIAIRQRNVLEIFDLSLHVLKDHFQPLFWLLIIGAAPWIAFDLWVCHWMADDFDYPMLFNWIMVLLVANQAQVGTSFMTHYLGQAMFVGKPGIGKIIRDTFGTSLYFVWIHGFLRMVVPAALLTLLLINPNEDSLYAISLFFLPAAVALGLLVRGFRPFVSEILMLEKTPIRKPSDGSHAYFGKRSNSLHGGAGSELFGRFITTCLLAIPLGFSCYSVFLIIDNVLNIRANSETSYAPYYFLASLWIVAGFLCITRFLSYIDIRIRQEGWAVELRMRAEGLRLTEAME